MYYMKTKIISVNILARVQTLKSLPNKALQQLECYSAKSRID